MDLKTKIENSDDQISLIACAHKEEHEKVEKISEELRSKLDAVGISVRIKAAYEIGQKIEDLHLNNVMEQGKIRLTHEEGKVFLLFFWATWCPPCQKPMAHNFKIRERNAENWKNVRIIAISTDENPIQV